MARTPKPWYWKARGEWYVTINKIRHRLGVDKDEADRRFHALMSQPPEEQTIGPGTIMEVIEPFMDWTKAHRAPRTYDFYQERIERFLTDVGNMRTTDLQPFHVQQWLDRQTWGNTYKAQMVTCLKRVFNWAVKQGYLEKNPLYGLEKPEPDRRDQLLQPEEFETFLAQVGNEAFRQLLLFVWYSGARPEEAIIIEARHYERQNKRIVLPKDEAKGRRRVRYIYLPEEAIPIVQAQVKAYPDGPIFRNTHAVPWNRHSVANTFDRVRIKLGRQRMKEQGITVDEKDVKRFVKELCPTKTVKGETVEKSKKELLGEARRKLTRKMAADQVTKVCMYALRHSFGNQSIVRAGLSLEETAAAMGHKDTRMVYQVYGHLVESPDHMQKLVNRSARARNGGSSPDGEVSVSPRSPDTPRRTKARRRAGTGRNRQS